MFNANIANETSIDKFNRKAIEAGKVIEHLKRWGQYDKIVSDMKQQEKYDKIFSDAVEEAKA
jgi:hypothetical protein